MIKSLMTMQNGKLDKKEMLKMAAGMVIGISADVVISMLLKKNLPPVRGYRKVAAAIGTFILSMKIGEDCENYFYKVWDETKDTLDEAKTEIEKAAVEGQVEANGSVE